MPNAGIKFGVSPTPSLRRRLRSGGSGTPTPPGCLGDGSPIGVMDGLTSTGAWSVSRKLFTAYAGSFYSLTSDVVDTLFDQSGNLRDLTQNFNPAFRPNILCDMSATVSALNYDGVDDALDSGALPASNFITVNAGYMIVSFKPTAFTTDFIPAYLNSALLQDRGENAGLTISDNSGSPVVWANNWTGSPKQVSNPVVANTAYVVEWRHEGGMLYNRLNGDTETSIVAGTTVPDLSLVLGLGGRFLAASFSGYIYEAATFAVVPDLTTRDALVQAFGTYVGAAV